MEILKAERKRAKIKMALQGPSGSGKTMSSLLLAYGLCSDWSKIAVIDTENHSAELYSNLGAYNVINIAAPYSPEKYQEAIKLCEQSGIEVIIIDSISHEWEGGGGILDIHSSMAGNSFTNWGKLTPRHNAFVQSILQSTCHVIGNIRCKQEYVLQEKSGKFIPEKVGLKGVTRDGMDYEFTIVLEIDIKHNATSSKDRTGLFSNKPEFQISVDTGKLILQWCNSGTVFPNLVFPDFTDDLMEEKINACTSVENLIALFKQQPKELQEHYQPSFTKRRRELEPVQIPDNLISHLPKILLNGKPNSSTSK